ncbi:methyl-accepting chemotaxis protein [Methylobacterium radiodurans]|uniref:methyl-accepting chemotaxis protein n=1 Tax=Methylobacterium radiodurans TaxID=2202828 RepID=UPI0013A56F90|nr:methyl-accepting chemotaxis protein [Methylobacterium radiodurans]
MFDSGIFALLWVSRSICRLTIVMNQVARGNDDAESPCTDRTNEVGAMARAFRDQCEMRRRLAAQHARAAEPAQKRHMLMVGLANDFETAVGGIATALAASATGIQPTAPTLTVSASQTAGQSTAVAAAAERAATDVFSGSGAAEERGVSVEEIRRQVPHSSDLVQNAVTEAGTASAVVSALSAAAVRIGDVVQMISTIASQITLLALSATIGAARAGDAGHGFAVAAAEVGKPAGQTTQATDGQIATIEGTMQAAVEAIAAISTIQVINEAAGSIAGAAEQQGAATREIVTAVSQTSAGTRAVTAKRQGLPVLARFPWIGRQESCGASGHQALPVRSIGVR